MPPRRLLLALLICALGFAQPANAKEDAGAALLASKDALVETELSPADGVLVGQKVVLLIRIRTTSFFKKAPDLPHVDVPRAIVRTESSTAVNSTDRVGDRSYATQTWERSIYPQRPGRYEVPALALTFYVAAEDGSIIPVRTKTQTLSFEARTPPGAPAGAALIATKSLQLTVVYDPPEGERKVGDAIQQTITRVLENAPAMLLPPIEPLEVAGLATYPREPIVSDKSNRGEVIGTRSEVTSYVMEAAGTYTFPEVSVPWWNIKTDTLETATAPALTIEVAPDPTQPMGARGGEEEGALGSGETSRSPSSPLPWVALFLLIVVAAFGVHRYRLRLHAWIVARQHAQTISPDAALSALEEDCRRNDARAAYADLQAFLTRSCGVAASPLTLALRGDDPSLKTAIEELDRHLFGLSDAEQAWDGNKLVACLPALRSIQRSGLRSAQQARTGGDWHMLNPRSAGAHQETP